MNQLLKENIGIKVVCVLSRFLHISKNVGHRRPPDFRSTIKNYRKFPFFKRFYDEDTTGPLKVVIDEINTYPPGVWGSMLIKDSWKFYKEGQAIRELPTFFDKLEHMTWKEYNCWFHTIQLPFKFPETLDFSQFITRTKVINNVPDCVKDSFNSISSDEIGKTSEFLKSCMDNYFMQTGPFTPKYDVIEQQRQSNELISQMMDSIARSRFSDDFFNNYSTSPNSLIETFFKRSGYSRLEAPEVVKDAEGFVKYRLRGKLAWQLRSRDPLKEFINVNESSNLPGGTDFNTYDYHPKMFNLEPADCEAFKNLPFIHSIFTDEYARNVPGYWGNSPFKVGDPCAFSVLGVINTDLSREFSAEYLPGHPEIIDRHHISEAILSGFTWTMAQAQNQGFSIYDDLTYPFCCCLMLTDGRQTQMVYYQLNSMASLWKPEDANYPPNVIWIGPKMTLLSLNSLGLVENIDEHAIHQILASFTMPKSDLSTEELQPYLTDTAPRDLKEIMIDFNLETATEKEIDEYKQKTKQRQIFRYGRSHPNRLFYVDELSKYDRAKWLRAIVPDVSRVPSHISNQIRESKLRRQRVMKGKDKVLSEPSEWM